MRVWSLEGVRDDREGGGGGDVGKTKRGEGPIAADGPGEETEKAVHQDETARVVDAERTREIFESVGVV